MKFPGKMCLKIILNVTKNQDSNLSLEDTFFEKLRGRGGGLNRPPPPAVLWLRWSKKMYHRGYIRERNKKRKKKKSESERMKEWKKGEGKKENKNGRGYLGFVLWYLVWGLILLGSFICGAFRYKLLM